MDSDGLKLCDTTCSYLKLKTSRGCFASKMGSKLCNCRLALASHGLMFLSKGTGHQSKTIKLNEYLHKPIVLLELKTGRQCDWKITPLINGSGVQTKTNTASGLRHCCLFCSIWACNAWATRSLLLIEMRLAKYSLQPWMLPCLRSFLQQWWLAYTWTSGRLRHSLW